MTQSNMSTPGVHAVDQVLGRADAHQVARLGRRAGGAACGDDALHVALRLADADAADGVAGQVELGEAGDRLLAQVLEHAALDDAEQRVGLPRRSNSARDRPAQRRLICIERRASGSVVRRPSTS
jgi:hypothetical protein